MNKEIKAIIKSARIKIEVTEYQGHISVSPIDFGYTPAQGITEHELRKFGDQLADFFDENLPIEECRESYLGHPTSPEVLAKLEEDIKEALYEEYGEEWRIALKDKLLSYFGISPMEIRITIERGFYE